MNFRVDFTEEQQKLLKQIDIEIEDKNYTDEEIKQCENKIANHIISYSSKNGDITKAMNKYENVMKILVRNEH